MNKSFWSGLAIVLGLLLIMLAVVYATTPADALPHFLPGYDASMSTVHVKHAIGAGLLGLAAFAFAWFQSGKKAHQK